MSKATMDRFEEDLAVLIVDGAERILPRAQLPADAREGDVVDLSLGRVDTQATEELREQVRQAREQALKKAPPPGDFEL